jgi:SWI/SNF-related matrix-associated actin-dependent regulator of chromatin subfamily A-like protein 1
MNYIAHNDDFIYFNATSSEAAKLGAVYTQKYRGYKLPINKDTLKDIMFYINHQKLTELYHKEVMEEASIKMMKTLNPAMQTAGKLRTYQAQDASLIRKYPVLAIFNEQRTGKTPTVLHALKDLTNGLIVCPSSLKLNWLREFEEWSDTKAVVVSGSKKKRMRIYSTLAEETMIISYETLRADINDILRMFKRFNYLVVDEAHRLRNHKTKQSMAVFKVRNLCERVYPMTGTPAVNHAANVYGIMKLLYPTKYASYWAFVERYFKVVDGMFGKEIYGIREERAQEFNNLLYMHSLQRKRRDVMSWLPKITQRIVELEPTTKQTTLFKQIIRKNELNGEVIDNPLTKLLRLRQVAVDPVYVGLDEQSPKFAFIMDYLEDNDDTVVVFSTMTGALKRLHKAIPGSMLLTGEQSTEQKEFAVRELQAGRCKVLLSNIKAGGTGFTMDKADTIIFLDKSYTPDENDQASDRIVPTIVGADYGAKQIITLLVNGSVEPRIEEMLKEKINIIQYVNDYGLAGLLE